MHHLPSRYIPCDGRLTSSAYFNPHSPQGERQSSSLLCVVLHYISIHAPRRGSDNIVRLQDVGKDISIHAPRMGSDFSGLHRQCRGQYFNPRSPQGERRSVDRNLPVIIDGFQSTLPAGGATRHIPAATGAYAFQSTLPAGGATRSCRWGYPTFGISIHAPRRGSDLRSVV